METMPNEVDFEVHDFEAQVIQRSVEVPVLVDFWAAWCGPCRFLGPIVEKLAGEAEGRWELVKVNTEHHPDLAQRFGIRGIPNLKLFFQGRVIAELPGALPEPQLKGWIEAQLPTEGRAHMQEASLLLQQGREEEAVALLEQVLAEEPALDEARLLLARILTMRTPEKVAPLLAHHLHLELATELTDLAGALSLGRDQLPEGPAKDLVWQGLEALRSDDPDGAMAPWVEAVMRDRGYAEELPRRLCVALLKLLGWEHPVSQAWRTRFHMALS